ncbi:cytochrome c oxidase assembly protein [Chelativorans salis]|uniref:Cytochrome c oxidase assembly protein n=1 Tax=Chelativorans salis TaxID=2978478 RepID=A0ABT2LIC7_9HYPH|nr:cytochrome c oxidase assembly protein [Chelativorans sp. EGI FJ00035]MCT7373981.1 cytochrome c oxidase assembly protein [Chelativorans sp. EGI FJ00035]
MVHIAQSHISAVLEGTLGFGFCSLFMLSGELTSHMTMHILAMNLLAPLLAYTLYRIHWRYLPHLTFLSAAAALQIALLWVWHVPAILAAAASSSSLSVVMHISLLLSALFFWISIIYSAARSPWGSIGALLVSGKLFCLLGVLLLFAPRPLYRLTGHEPTASMASQLADQQMAGLLMLIVCPLTYVLGSILVARHWLISTERSPDWRFDG